MDLGIGLIDTIGLLIGLSILCGCFSLVVAYVLGTQPYATMIAGFTLPTVAYLAMRLGWSWPALLVTIVYVVLIRHLGKAETRTFGPARGMDSCLE